MTYKPPHLTVLEFLLGLPKAEQEKLADENEVYSRLIFRDGLPFKIVGTGLRAITLTSSPGENPSAHATGALVSVRLYADHTRAEGKPPEKEDGVDRAWAMFGNLDAHLQAADPLFAGSQVVQADRQAQPLESFDQEQDCPYLAVPYNVTVYEQR